MIEQCSLHYLSILNLEKVNRKAVQGLSLLQLAETVSKKGITAFFMKGMIVAYGYFVSICEAYYCSLLYMHIHSSGGSYMYIGKNCVSVLYSNPIHLKMFALRKLRIASRFLKIFSHCWPLGFLFGDWYLFSLKLLVMCGSWIKFVLMYFYKSI